MDQHPAPEGLATLLDGVAAMALVAATLPADSPHRLAADALVALHGALLVAHYDASEVHQLHAAATRLLGAPGSQCAPGLSNDRRAPHLLRRVVTTLGHIEALLGHYDLYDPAERQSATSAAASQLAQALRHGAVLTPALNLGHEELATKVTPWISTAILDGELCPVNSTETPADRTSRRARLARGVLRSVGARVVATRAADAARQKRTRRARKV